MSVRSKLFPLLGVALVGAAFWFWQQRGHGPGSTIPAALVSRGEFRQTVTESGEIEATRAMTVSSPRVGDWGTRPQITWLADEGTQVGKGDVIARFDPSGIEKVIFQKRADLQIKEANLARTKATQRANAADMQAAVQNTQASFELARLALDELQFEADVRKREGELRFAQARNDLERSRAKIESQRVIDAEELRRIELELGQARAELEKAEEDMASLQVKAPADGLIVYERNWNTGNKFQVGDTPWPGQAIIGLPDLSEMRVKTQVNEIDISKLELKLPVGIRLDAFDGPRFRGKVSDIATLGHDKDDGSEVKVFEVHVLIDTTASILKPGMTASCEIIVQELSDTLSIPLDAVFADGEQPIVYVEAGGGWRKQPVELGLRSSDRVVVVSGLEEGARVALVDPAAASSIQGAQLEELAQPKAGSPHSRRQTRRIIVN
jgi:RND family efflux transporter MFP subunit